MVRHALAALGLIVALPAKAADITPVTRGDPGFAEIVVTGPLSAGDGDRFSAVARRYGRGVVTFDSRGGNLFEAIAIGETIRAQGFDTRVDEGASCLSACALAWVAGRTRAMSGTALVAFGTADPGSGAGADLGNALVGAYLTRLGLPYSAVAYIVSAGNRTDGLDVDRARRSGIEVSVLPDANPPRLAERGDQTGSLPRDPLVVESFLVVRGLGPMGRLAIRVAPDGNAPIKFRARDGDRFAWIGSQGPWRGVRLASGETGWAHSSFLAALLPPPPRDGAVPPVPGRNDFYYVADMGDVLLLRVGPSTDAPWTLKMAPGTLLSLLDREGEWLKVEVVGGPTGWAHSAYVECCRRQ